MPDVFYIAWAIGGEWRIYHVVSQLANDTWSRRRSQFMNLIIFAVDDAVAWRFAVDGLLGLWSSKWYTPLTMKMLFLCCLLLYRNNCRADDEEVGYYAGHGVRYGLLVSMIIYYFHALLF